MTEPRAGAEAEIRRLHAEYVFYADRGRAAELVGLFTADGVYRNVGGAYDGMVHQGRDAIAAYLLSVVDDFATAGVIDVHRHHVSPARAEFLDEGTARAESYFVAMRSFGPDHWGVYRDVLVDDGGRWRFAERKCVIEGTANASWQHEVGRRRRAVGSAAAP
jgi:hypothetical protein